MSNDRRDNGWLKIGELPVLRMATIEEVVLHEAHDDERVGRLVERFAADGILKNPPVVAPVDGTGRRIVLDGANRMTALKKMGIPHVVVQDIDVLEEGFSLQSWHHAVEHMQADELLAAARAVPGFDEFPGAHDDALIRIRFRDGHEVSFRGSEDLPERVDQLQRFTRIYHRATLFDRVSYTDPGDLERNYPDFTALISFDPFTMQDLIDATGAGQLIPSGITRVILPKRALRLNLPLDLLRSDLPLDEKEIRLQEDIRTRVAAKAIRFYREPTFFFDE